MVGEVALDSMTWEVVGRPPWDQGKSRAVRSGESFGKVVMDKGKPAETIMRLELFGKAMMGKT